tara:strand:+ start:40 stop:477 length:438 start_codon:yes stop_codon:yes gene_type:complete
MTELKNGAIDRVKDYNNWLRVFFMLAYGIVLLHIVVPIVAVVMVAQVLCTFGSGRLNSNLTVFGESLVDYIQQTIDFLLYKSNEKPFPFKPFPNFGQEANNKSETESSEIKVKPKLKTAAKKKPVKKAVRSKKVKKKVSTQKLDG